MKLNIKENQHENYSGKMQYFLKTLEKFEHWKNILTCEENMRLFLQKREENFVNLQKVAWRTAEENK